jgi:nucleoside triphosphatase
MAVKQNRMVFYAIQNVDCLCSGPKVYLSLCFESPTARIWFMSEQYYPEPTVGALIFNPQGELFLMSSHKWHGRYVVPGGHIELGERMEDALRREVMEETNLQIFGIKFLIFQEFIFDPVFWKPGHYIFLDFTCITDSTDVVLNEEAQSYIWIHPQLALNLPLDPYTRRAIRKYLERPK